MPNKLLMLALCVIFAPVSLPSQSQDYQVIALQSNWRRVDRVYPWPSPELLWRGEPLIAPRGVNLYKNMLFVTDPGDRRASANKPARIVKFTAANGNARNPVIFFSRPGFLFSAKWSIPVTVGGEDFLIIADQGRELPDGSFTGEGGKVFLLPILRNGVAGEPRVLWAGSPLVCPTGVAVVGDYIYITDPCAGPVITRPESPGHPFTSSAIFALKLTGAGPPILIQSGRPYTSLIAVCPATPGELIVNDTDSGRIDPTNSGGRPNFAPSASADRWVLKILSTSTPSLSDPQRTPFTEDGPVTLKFSNLPENAVITIISAPDFTILDPFNNNRPAEEITFPATRLNRNGTVTFIASSDVLSDYVCTHVRVDIVDSNTSAVQISLPTKRIDLFKDFTQPTQFVDNKHGGRRRAGPNESIEYESIVFDRSNTTFDYYTTDSAPGHAAVWIYPRGGGTPVAIAKGAPLIRPVSGQLSDNSKKLWIVDQANGSLYVMPFPGPDVYDRLFPFRQRNF